MISYKNIFSAGINAGDPMGDIQRFKRGKLTDGLAATDNPDNRFFKLLFYFNNDDENDNAEVDWYNGGSTGLLATTWVDNPTGDYYKYNSAWAYLKNNYEEERADALKTFVSLLAEVSSESPWYFSEISGVDEALARENWKVSDERKKISIVCLDDPVDHRIESLLSLYRSIVWSHTRKCEVLPANLRKFDMGLFIFSGSYIGLTHWQGLNGLEWANMGFFDHRDNVSYKYIEFQNCEISMDSIKSGYNSISNESGFNQKFTIDIYFDDCYEHEYNPFILRGFGDFFLWDLWDNTMSENILDQLSNNEKNEQSKQSEINRKLNYFRSAENQNKYIKDSLQNTEGQQKTQREYIKDSLRNTGRNILRTLEDAVTGGLGNIYGNGYGAQGILDATDQELMKQYNSLKNKITGNVYSDVTNVARSVTEAAITPSLGVISKTGAFVSDLVDAVDKEAVIPTGESIVNTTKVIMGQGQSDTGQIKHELGNITRGNNVGLNRLNTQS